MPYALRQGMAAFRRAPLLSALSIAMIGLSLFVIGVFGVVAYNLRLVIDRVESRVQIVAYLRDTAPPGEVEAMRAGVEAMPAVSDVIYISRAQALETARRELGDLRPVFAELETNPLPASLEVGLRPGQRDAEAVRDVADRISRFDIVEDVRYGNEWLDKVFLLRRIAAATTLVLGGAFALVAVLIIGAAVRMAIYARRDEIAIMRLVGATTGFIRRPFLIEGLIAGTIGGVLALPLTYLTYDVLSRSIFELDWIPYAWIVAGVIAGSLLGVVASAAAVHRHLREV
ncbi:MAG: cell division protein FtsX [Longimicrobiales bacterium]